jgi:DNA-binding transcriptional ArsR family regulator
MTQRHLKRLEEQRVLVSRRLGNMRLFRLNERNPTVRNLRKLLEVELAALPEDDQQQYFLQRQRPRALSRL